MVDRIARKRNYPLLAIIVISLLVVMGLIAWVESDGRTVAEDSGETMPVDLGEEAPVMPIPNPGAPVPERR